MEKRKGKTMERRTDPDRVIRTQHAQNVDPDIFITRLNRLMNELEISMGRISTDCGFCRDLIGSYLRRETMPNARTLLYICNYLNISADWLLGLSDEKKPIWE